MLPAPRLVVLPSALPQWLGSAPPLPLAAAVVGLPVVTLALVPLALVPLSLVVCASALRLGCAPLAACCRLPQLQLAAALPLPAAV